MAIRPEPWRSPAAAYRWNEMVDQKVCECGAVEEHQGNTEPPSGYRPAKSNVRVWCAKGWSIAITVQQVAAKGADSGGDLVAGGVVVVATNSWARSGLEQSR